MWLLIYVISSHSQLLSCVGEIVPCEVSHPIERLCTLGADKQLLASVNEFVYLQLT